VSTSPTLLTLDKPPKDLITATTRDQGLPGFYLSSSLLVYLKEFPKAYKLRTSYGMGWDQADGIAMDAEKSREVFQYGRIPAIISGEESTQFEDNIPLVAFRWTLRRFIEAPKYCLVSRGYNYADVRIVDWR
jgi:hypothetical protein